MSVNENEVSNVRPDEVRNVGLLLTDAVSETHFVGQLHQKLAFRFVCFCFIAFLSFHLLCRLKMKGNIREFLLDEDEEEGGEDR